MSMFRYSLQYISRSSQMKHKYALIKSRLCRTCRVRASQLLSSLENYPRLRLVKRISRSTLDLNMTENNGSTEPCRAGNPTSEGKLANEGKAEVYLPTSVFYNPVQEFNRDLTISVIREQAKFHISKLKENKGKKKGDEENKINEPQIDQLKAKVKYETGLRVFEGLAASGLRSVRFALEIPGLREVVANDLDYNAVEFIKKNVEHNKIEDLVTPNWDDASLVMYKNRKFADRFDVIDLDPYGSPTLFLDGAVQAVQDGGLLCVTCTDMAVLCGNAIEKCHASYGAVSLKARFCHEFALRILLQCVESHANHYGRYIEPLLSISADFYIRAFLRIHTSQSIVKQSVTKLSMVYHCTGCGAFHLQPMAHKTPTKGGNYKYTPSVGPPVGSNCTECGFKFHLGGPVWTDPLHDVEFVQKLVTSTEKNKKTELKVQTADRILGMLSVVSEELLDQPFYYITDDLCKTLHCTPPSFLQIRSAILDARYKVSLSHAAQNSLKTDAPSSVMWDIMRCWVKKNPVNMEKLKAGSPGRAILDKEPTLEVSFNIREDANPQSRQKGLRRWQQKPERDWGPKPRARQGQVETLDDRRAKGIQKSKERRAKRKVEQEEDMNEEATKKMNKTENDAS